MVQVHLILDLVTPQVGRRRAERTVRLPGVPSAGDGIEVARALSLKVSSVLWRPRQESAMVFLTRFESSPPSIVDHDGELELHDSRIDDLREAGWTIGEFE